jgi:hypothetical protein
MSNTLEHPVSLETLAEIARVHGLAIDHTQRLTLAIQQEVAAVTQTLLEVSEALRSMTASIREAQAIVGEAVRFTNHRIDALEGHVLPRDPSPPVK